ncbi:MAG: hypothetical protein KY475_03160 [Planctomycetes bacterium]|nr:hypothetical protein [Planctomycetota bacterium]
MDFRRNGSRDERRRRVLMDESAADAAPGDEASSAPKRSRAKTESPAPSRYAGAAWEESQPRITSLLPTRRLTLWAWLLACSAAVGLLGYLHVAVAGWKERLPEVDFAPLELAARGSLGAWLASLLLAWASIVAVQVFLIRRHRNDDYQGTYRLWLTLAAALGLGSIVAATKLDVMAGELVAVLCGIPAHATLIRVLLIGAVAAACSVRSIWEIKPSRGALSLLAAAMTCYLAVALLSLGVVKAPAPWTTGGGALAALIAHVFVLLTVGVFGRYVHLEARGELMLRPRKEKRPRAKAARRRASAEAAAETPAPRTAKKRAAKTDLEETASKKADEKPAPVANSKPASKSPTLAIADEEEEDRPAALSKAERRRLRKQNKQQQRAA